MGRDSRWRLEDVHAMSPRGLAGSLLLALMFLGIVLSPLAEAVRVVATGRAAELPTISRELLYVNLAYGLFALGLLPILYLAAVRRGGSPTRLLGFRWSRRSILYVAASVAATIGTLFALASLVYALSQAGLFQEDPSDVLVDIKTVLTWDLVLLVPIVSALTEEIFFRGFLQPRIGLIASSLLFGLVHIGYGTILQVVVPVLMGLLFGLLYKWSKTLWAPITAHFTFNFVQLVILYTVEA